MQTTRKRLVENSVEALVEMVTRLRQFPASAAERRRSRLAGVHQERTVADSSACEDFLFRAPVSVPQLQASVFPINQQKTNF